MNKRSYVLVLCFGVVLSARLTMAIGGFEMELLMTKLDYLQDKMQEVEQTMKTAMESSLKKTEHRLQEKLTEHEKNINEKIEKIEAKMNAINPFEPNTMVSEAATKISMSYELVLYGFAWVKAENGEVPSGAVLGGRTSLGENLYIERVNHDGDLIPGKVHPSHKNLFVSFGGKEHYYQNYEVLVEVRRGFRIGEGHQ